MISTRAVIKIVVVAIILPILSGCTTPSLQGRFMGSKDDVTPVLALKVVFVFPKSQEWKGKEGEKVQRGLAESGYFDGGFEKKLAQEWQANFAANGINADIFFSEKAVVLDETNASGTAHSHLLIIDVKAFQYDIHRTSQLYTYAQLIDQKKHRLVWQSYFSIMVTTSGSYVTGRDETFLAMLNSWSEYGIVRLNTKSAKTSKGKSRILRVLVDGLLVE